MNDINILASIARELEEGKKCILLHVNVDPDALGSASALALAFSEITIGTCVKKIFVLHFLANEKNSHC